MYKKNFFGTTEAVQHGTLVNNTKYIHKQEVLRVGIVYENQDILNLADVLENIGVKSLQGAK